MNKRSFFKTLGSAVVGIYLGLGVKPLVKEKIIESYVFENEVFVFPTSLYDAIIKITYI